MKKTTSKWTTRQSSQLSAVVTAIVVGSIVGGVVLAKGNPHTGGSSGGPIVYLSPSSGNYTVGSTLSVAIRENSGTTGVNAVQAGFSYSPTQLQFEAIDGSSSPFTTDFSPPTQSTGSVLVTRSSLAGNITGDQLVAMVNFQVLAGGRSSLTMTSTCGQGAAAANCTSLASNGSALTISTTGADYKL